MTEKIALRVQHKRMTKEDWLKSDAILLEGEIGVESDTGYIKAGNGTDYFPDLPYLSGPPGIIVKGQFDYLEDLKNTYPTGNFGEGYQIKNEDKTVYAWGERHATKSASGSAITLEDSATANLKGLRLYGKSWQDGVPAVQAPVAINSVNNPVVSLCGKNLLNDGEKYRKNKSYEVASYRPVTPLIEGVTYTITIDAKINEPSGRLVPIVSIGWFPLCDMFFTPNKREIVSKTFVARYAKNRTPQDDIAYGDIAIYQMRKTIFGGGYDYPDCEIFSVKVELGDVTKPTEDTYQSGGSLTIPYDLNAVPVSSGGNYTDETGQQWVADYIDFNKGILVKNCAEYNLNTRDMNNSESYPGWLLDKNDITRVFGEHLNSSFPNSYMDNQGANLWVNTAIGCIFTSSFGKPQSEVKKNDLNVQVVTESKTKPYQTIPLSDSELQAYAKLHTLYPYTTILNDQGAHTEVDYQSMEIEGEWLDVGKFHTNTNDVTQLQADMLMKANKRDLVDDVPRINELEGKIKELSSKIDRIVANGT